MVQKCIMMVYCCSKCKKLSTKSTQTCPHCEGKLIPLGVDSSKWNTLSKEQMVAVINKRLAAFKNVNQEGLVEPDWEEKPQRSNAKGKSICSDKFIWALATVPLAVSWFGPALFGLRGTILTIIVIVLNIVFMTCDATELKKAGLDANSWLWLGFVLVPVYLFVRESKTNRNWAPGIVWCVLFFIDLL